MQVNSAIDSSKAPLAMNVAGSTSLRATAAHDGRDKVAPIDPDFAYGTELVLPSGKTSENESDDDSDIDKKITNRSPRPDELSAGVSSFLNLPPIEELQKKGKINTMRKRRSMISIKTDMIEKKLERSKKGLAPPKATDRRFSDTDALLNFAKETSGSLNIMITSFNLGNSPPTSESLKSWLPADGNMFAVVDAAKYDLPEHDLAGREIPDDGVGFGSQEEYEEGRKFDIIAIGMQESTFRDVTTTTLVRSNSDPIQMACNDLNNTLHIDARRKSTMTKTAPLLANIKEALEGIDSYSESDNEDEECLPKVPPPGELKSRRRSSAVVQYVVNKANDGVHTVTSMTASKDMSVDSEGKGQGEMCKRFDTNFLNNLISQRCPSYECRIQYMLGEMRLFVLVRRELLGEISDVECRAESTGISKIFANKGGIAATMTIRGTHLSFVTAHLEAHEGKIHYSNRCNNISQILSKAKVGFGRRFDVSVHSHHCFVFGDLNYRVALPHGDESEWPTDEQEKHRMEVKKMVEKRDWESLNKADELNRALRHQDCLAGFTTVPCHFPPTFKVKREKGNRYDEKRTPSYTDRILWKSADGFDDSLVPLAYGPCSDTETSDHKPIRGAFSLLTCKGRKAREGAKTEKISRPLSLSLADGYNSAAPERSLYLIVSQIACTDLPAMDPELWGGKSDPYIYFSTNPKELLLSQVKEIEGRKLSTSQEDKHWPRTKVIPRTLNPVWQDEFVTMKLHGISSEEELVGALMFITAMDYDVMKSDDLIGTIQLSLEKLCSDISAKGVKRRRSHLMATPMPELFKKQSGWVQRTDINHPFLRNGQTFGNLTCTIYATWLSDAEYKNAVAGKEPKEYFKEGECCFM